MLGELCGEVEGAVDGGEEGVGAQAGEEVEALEED